MHDFNDAPSASSTDQPAPIALAPEEGEAVWAFGTLATLKATGETTNGRVAVIEHLAPGEQARHCTSITVRTSGSSWPRAS